MGITSLPEDFIALMYQSIVNKTTKKINLLLLKQFIDVCQDSYLVNKLTKEREIKEILQNAGLEDPPSATKSTPIK
jgi:hypothetical protein